MGSPAFSANLSDDLGSLLDGLDYPANVQDIHKVAQENWAGQDMLDRIDSMPDQFYDNISDIIKLMQSPYFGRDADGGPAHMSSQAAEPGEFRASALESKRSLEDGRDD